MKEAVPPVENMPVYCVDCLQEIDMDKPSGTILCHLDSRLMRWVCPSCYAERKEREAKEYAEK